MVLTLPFPAIDLSSSPTMLRFQHVALLLPLAGLLFLGGARDSLPIPQAAPAARLTLWAWERSEDLRYLSHNVRVAYLAGSIYLEPQPVLRSRMQPLRVGE